MDDKKNNSMTIIIVIVAIALAALAAFFVFNSMDNKDNTSGPTTTENDTTDDTSDESTDVAGAYTGTYNKNSNVLEDAADAVTDNKEDRVTVELVLEEDGTATFVKTGDTEETIRGTYTHSDGKVILTRTDNATDEDTDVADDKATTDNDITDDETTTDKTDADDTDRTYEFTINVDGSLSYKEKDTSTDMVMLNKTDRSNLKHIK